MFILKKELFIILLCFMVAFAAFAIDMSPHPGDTLETVFTMQDNVVISQAVSAPADMLYLENYNDIEICLTANDEMIESPYYLMGIDYYAVMAVVYIDFEMGTINLNTVGLVAIDCTEYG